MTLYVFVLSPDEDNCPVDVTHTLDDDCYYISNTHDPAQLKTWADARDYCINMADGATLLIITNPEEMVTLL